MPTVFDSRGLAQLYLARDFRDKMKVAAAGRVAVVDR